jgi:hypothetical protein
MIFIGDLFWAQLQELQIQDAYQNHQLSLRLASKYRSAQSRARHSQVQTQQAHILQLDQVSIL